MKIKLISAIILLALFSCNGNKQEQLNKLKKQQTQIADQIKKLETDIQSESNDSLNTEKFKFIGVMDVKKSSFDHYIRVQGSLDGDQNSGVFAEVPGTIIAKYADVGQQVKKGQVLAQIDDSQYRKQLEGLETQYQFASDVYEKQKRLWDQKIGSEVQYLQSKTNKESLEQQIASLKQQIDKFKIKSSVDGTIEECNIKLGGVVSPNPLLVAYRVVAFTNLKVRAEVSEAYSSRVNKGDKLEIIFPDIHSKIESKVEFASKYISPVNRTFEIEAKIDKFIPHLKANMVAIIQINDYHAENAIVVPVNYIQKDALGSYVYIVRPKNKYYVAVKQPVTVGSSYNGISEIIQGLNSGDKVISAGYNELMDGEYVRF